MVHVKWQNKAKPLSRFWIFITPATESKSYIKTTIYGVTPAILRRKIKILLHNLNYSKIKSSGTKQKQNKWAYYLLAKTPFCAYTYAEFVVSGTHKKNEYF